MGLTAVPTEFLLHKHFTKGGMKKIDEFWRREDRYGCYNYLFGNFIVLGCALFITLSVFAYFIEKLDNVVLQVGILMIVIFAEIA